MALVGSAPGSPLQPPLPAGDAGAGPLAALMGAAFGGRIASDDTAAVVASVLAIVLVVVGFGLVARVAWRGDLSLRATFVLAVLGCVVVLAMPLLYSRDVYSYALYGRIASFHHANPYVVTPAQVSADPFFPLVGSQWRSTTSVYGPVFTMLSVGLTRVFEGPAAVVAAFRALAVLSVLGAAALIARTCMRVRPGVAAFAVAVFALNPAVLFQTAGSGHNDAFVALAIAAAMAFVASRRELAATVVLVLGTLVKSTCGVALLLWIVVVVARRRGADRWRALALHLGTAIGLAIITALPFLRGGDPTLGQTQLADHEGWLAPARVVRVLIERIGDAVSASAGNLASDAVRIVFAGILIGAVLVIAIVAARVGRGASPGSPLEPEEVGASWGWGFLAVMLFGPVLLPWYVAWGLPVAWALPRLARRTMLVVSVLAMLSLFAADAVTFPDAFQLTARWANYVLAPIALVLAFEPARDLVARWRRGGDLAQERETPVGNAS
jgi:alpha-1,6-mannosyltransferase